MTVMIYFGRKPAISYYSYASARQAERRQILMKRVSSYEADYGFVQSMLSTYNQAFHVMHHALTIWGRHNDDHKFPTLEDNGNNNNKQ